MARVIFDGRCMQRKTHGIGRYALGALDAILPLADEHELVVLRADDFLAEHLAGKPARTVETDIKLYGVREIWAIPRLLGKLGADLFYTPSFSAPPLGSCPQIMTIHDVTHLIRGMTSARYRAYYDWVIGPAARRSKTIMTETETTARLLRKRFRLRHGQVLATAPGAGLSAQPPQGVPRELMVMCQVNAKPHKNADGALRAFVRLQRQVPGVKLEIVGGLPERLIRQVERMPDVTHHPFLDDAGQAAVMARARVFLWPTISEGFGFPPLEAMLGGLPVVSSCVSCMPEVLGDAVLYTDPADPQQMADQLARLLEDEALAERYREAGRAHAATYTWEPLRAAVARVVREALR